jgi:hypothetical protein
MRFILVKSAQITIYTYCPLHGLEVGIFAHRNFVECIEMLKECTQYKSGVYSLQSNDSASR